MGSKCNLGAKLQFGELKNFGFFNAATLTDWYILISDGSGIRYYPGSK